MFVVAFLLNRRAPTADIHRFDPAFTRIRCPLCQWQPQKSDRWYCSPGCYHCWNTFDTAGVCPGCDKHWQETACLKFHGWSLHEAWYESSRE